jgi:hypothetical protein
MAITTSSITSKASADTFADDELIRLMKESSTAGAALSRAFKGRASRGARPAHPFRRGGGGEWENEEEFENEPKTGKILSHPGRPVDQAHFFESLAREALPSGPLSDRAFEGLQTQVLSCWPGSERYTGGRSNSVGLRPPKTILGSIFSIAGHRLKRPARYRGEG